MHYEILRGLYLGESSNADLSSTEVRERLHVATPLDDLIPSLVAQGRDVVLTGNPGDGKSHLVRQIMDRGLLKSAEVELDLSAHPDEEVIARWRAARRLGRPFVLCANQGPLMLLVEGIGDDPELTDAARELSGQLGRLISPHPDRIAPEPREAALLDLADRNLLNETLIGQAINRVAHVDFLPPGFSGADTSAGQNLMLLVEAPEARQRLGRLVAFAGRRLGEHVTFRHLWQCIAYGITAGKAVSTLNQELSTGKIGLGHYPLDHLAARRGQGPLVDAVRRFADPGVHSDPDMDEDLWTTGQPRKGRWIFDPGVIEAPATIWGETAAAQQRALDQLAAIKRLVALAHELGDEMITRIVASGDAAIDRDDEEIVDEVLGGISALYLPPGERAGAPSWLCEGLPLWIGQSYEHRPVSSRPHVTVSTAEAAEFRLLRPTRASWLGDAMGPPPCEAWLLHKPSNCTLRIDSDLLTLLRRAAQTDGPLEPPESIQRFLSKLAGFHEKRPEFVFGHDMFAVLDQPRGHLVAAASISTLSEGGARYGSH